MDVERRARPPVARDLEAREPREQIAEGDARLEPRQRRAQAEVDAVPERDVRVGRAPMPHTTNAPAGMIAPPIAISRRVARNIACTGVR